MTTQQKAWRNRIICALIIFVLVMLAVGILPIAQWLGSEEAALWLEFALYLIPYLIAGYDVLWNAVRSIGRGRVLDENFLMSVATVGAFALVFFPDSDPHMAEGAAVILFYQVGELFQSYAVGKSRQSIAAMMDIAPDYATVEKGGELVRIDPEEVEVGQSIVVKPGERIPLDGRVTSGSSELDTAALTGESLPRHVEIGDEVISGCINMSGLLTIQTTKVYAESTVSRILELVENASEKKARTENFITRFARYYTPVVVLIALALALIPPLFAGQSFSDWLQRGLTFLVVSCPCALVISVPLSFFGGIGGASRLGILVKGSNYLEVLAKTNTVVFDKTGTLTNGSFEVVGIYPQNSLEPNYLLECAAHAEFYSDHPIAHSIKEAFAGELKAERIQDIKEKSGHGITALLDGKPILVGNETLMQSCELAVNASDAVGTVIHIALDGKYLGYILIADVVKNDARSTLAELRKLGVRKTIMLTGDQEQVAHSVAESIGIDEYHAQLLPHEKVACLEKALEHVVEGGKLAFVGDGINDAPVLTRADIGIAMGVLGSDAAIEAADVVLMDDRLSCIADAIRIARKTMRIVWQNIIFALTIKFAVLLLAAFGFANMWLAVFADVGVAVLAILNAMRCMNVHTKR